MRKPDNNVVTAAVENTSSTYVYIVTTEQMTACEGVNLCELRITDGDDVLLGTLNFNMKVEADPLKDGIESETEIHNLETQIRDIDEEIVPGLVAQEVENQYDSSNVIFDDHPTPGHGTGYVVKSENVPAELNDLDDVDISGQAQGEALVWDSVNNKWVNGTVSTVGGLNDLNDVTIDDNSLEQGQELVYNGTEEVFENKTTRVELTQAEYDALANPLPNVDYYITDAPSMQGSSKELSYDGGTDSVYDVLNPTAYSTTGLSYTNCSYVAGGYCKIGSLVIVNMRITVTGAIANGTDFITGFPKPIDENTNMVQVSNNANNGFTLKKDGSLSNGSTGLSSGNAVLFSVAYLTRDI